MLKRRLYTGSVLAAITAVLAVLGAPQKWS